MNLLPHEGAAEDCPTLATVAGGADVTPYEDEDEPETDEDEEETHDDLLSMTDPLSLLRYTELDGAGL